MGIPRRTPNDGFAHSVGERMIHGVPPPACMLPLLDPTSLRAGGSIPPGPPPNAAAGLRREFTGGLVSFVSENPRRRIRMLLAPRSALHSQAAESRYFFPPRLHASAICSVLRTAAPLAAPLSANVVPFQQVGGPTSGGFGPDRFADPSLPSAPRAFGVRSGGEERQLSWRPHPAALRGPASCRARNTRRKPHSRRTVLR